MQNVHYEIEAVLFRFMRAFDDKDWQTMLNCLCDTVYCDYSSFHATEPAHITNQEYVAQRQQVLVGLKTQHNLSNLLISIVSDIANVQCNYAIYRFLPEFTGSREQFFHSYGQYHFELKCMNHTWKIASITQKLLTNEGNSEIHGATRTK